MGLSESLRLRSRVKIEGFEGQGGLFDGSAGVDGITEDDSSGHGRGGRGSSGIELG